MVKKNILKKKIKGKNIKKTEKSKVIVKNPINMPKLKRKDIFDIGDLLSITNREGVTFVGKFNGFVQGNYYLLDVEVTSIQYSVESSWVLVDMSTISHIFPKNAKLIPLEKNLIS